MGRHRGGGAGDERIGLRRGGLPRRFDREAATPRGGLQPKVIGQHPVARVTQIKRCGQLNGVEGSQRWGQQFSRLGQKVRCDRNEIYTVDELFQFLLASLATPQERPADLGERKFARDEDTP